MKGGPVVIIAAAAVGFLLLGGPKLLEGAGEGAKENVNPVDPNTVKDSVGTPFTWADRMTSIPDWFWKYALPIGGACFLLAWTKKKHPAMFWVLMTAFVMLAVGSVVVQTR